MNYSIFVKKISSKQSTIIDTNTQIKSPQPNKYVCGRVHMHYFIWWSKECREDKKG